MLEELIKRISALQHTKEKEDAQNRTASIINNVSHILTEMYRRGNVGLKST